MSAASFVVAFHGRRDAYQVPLALAEAGMLAALVTELYLPDALRAPGGGSGLRSRYAPGLSSRLVSRSARALLVDLARRGGLTGDHAAFGRIDAVLSRRAVEVALERGADLFLYSQYAREAFGDPRAAPLRRGLFVFHPHADAVARILLEDLERHPECAWSMRHEQDTATASTRARLCRDEWRAADLLVCASSFTASTLVAAGCRPEAVRVVPYGIDAPLARRGPRSPGACRFLFVGQGVQRKGLHHLLRAWRRLGARAGSLTVVASPLDPGIAALASPDVRILPRLSAAALGAELERADVLVLPSLVEGFGQVYLEALAAGCFCIGSDHSGLPDLALPGRAASVVPAGSIEALAETLVATASAVRAGEVDPAGIQELARAHGWQEFRSGIRAAAASLAAMPRR